MDRTPLERLHELIPGGRFEYEGANQVWACGPDGVAWGCGQTESQALKDATANYTASMGRAR